MIASNFHNFAKMKSIDSHSDSDVKKAGAPDNRPREELPVLKSLFSLNSKKPDGLEEGVEVGYFKMGFLFDRKRFIGFQKCDHPVIIIFWRINRL